MKSEVHKKAEKRSTEIIIFTVILAAGTAATTYSNTNILDAGTSNSNGLVAEYRFDTGAGNTAYDTAGNNEGTINGASWTSGVKSGALKFDGSEDVKSRETGALDLTEEITISSWVRWQGGGVKWHGIVSKGNSQPYGLTLNSPNKFAHFEWARSGCGQRLDTQANSVETGTWEHIVATYDRNKMRIYVDGELEAESSLSDCSPSTTDQKLRIGQGNNGEYFKGKLDTTRIYSEALDHSQIKSLYNSGSWRIGTTTKEDDPSKVLDISFQHQNSSHVYDTSGYENHGTRENGVGQASSVDCKIGRCYSFDGNDDYVAVSGLPDFSDTNEVTVSARAKSDDEDWADTGWITSRRNQFIIHPDSGSKQVDFYVHTVNSGWSRVAYSPDDITKWHHYSLSYDGSVLSAYVDGEQVDSTTINEQLTSDTGVMTVGRDDGRNRYGDGKVDEVRIYNRSLSQQEIIEKTQGLDSGGAVLDLRFNRDGGDKAYDYSGEDNHGVLRPSSSTGPKWANGAKGNALSFDGDDDHVDILDDSSFTVDGFTMSTWVKIDSNGDYGIMSNYGGSAQHYGLRYGDGGGQYSPALYYDDDGSSGYGYTNLLGSSNLNDGEWHHVVGKWNGREGKTALYVDGELEALSDNEYQGTLNPSSALEVGNDAAGSHFEFDGSIDNAKILPYAASKSRIQGIYEKGSSSIGSSSKSGTNLQNGLVLSQTFNRIETCGQSDTITCPSGASGEIAVDESGEANHGELINSPEVAGPEECIVGTCIRSTESSRIQDEDPSNLPESDSARTLSGWFKMTDTDKAGVFGYGNPNTNEGFQFYTPNGLGDELQFDFWGTNEGGVDDVIPSIKEKWYHVAATYDGNTITVYRNGQKIDSASYTGLNTNSERFVAGAELDRNDEFEGLYDQIKVFDRSLSEKQIWKLYTQGRDRSDGMAGAIGHWGLDQDILWSDNFCKSDSRYVKTEHADRGGLTNGGWITDTDNCELRSDNSNSDLTIHSSPQIARDVGSVHVKVEYLGTDDNDGSGAVIYDKSSERWWTGTITNDHGCNGIGYIEGGNINCVSGGDNYDTTDPHTFDLYYRNGDLQFYVNGSLSATHTVDISPDGYGMISDAQSPSARFDSIEVSSYNAVDSSGEKNHGQLVGFDLNPAWGSGEKGEALEFDGSDDYVVSQSKTGISGEDSRTITGWFRVDSFSTDDSWSVPFSIGDDQNDELFEPLIDNDEEDLHWHVWDTYPQMASIKGGERYHFTLTYDGSEVKAYLDGELKDTNSISLSTEDREMRIGQSWSNDRELDGAVDDVRIYPYALNQDQVKQVMNSGAVSVG